MDRPLRALIVDDSEDDAILIARALTVGGFQVSFERVYDGAAMRRALAATRWDVILADHAMPGFDSGQALRILRETGLDIPFIIVSGVIGEEAAVAAMRAGASDFVLKHHLGRLAPAVQRELRDAAERAARRVAERLAGELSEKLLNAQRLDGIGRLAGGVAHDFNNLLTVITGYAELLRLEPDPSPLARHAVDQIAAAVDSAAVVTRQLLAFSRRQIIAPREINLNVTVEQLTKIVGRMVGEDVRILTSLSPELGLTNADPVQVEQILLNLVANAREAMPGGGTLRIETANVRLDATDASPHPSIRPGSYVMLSVADSGVGMDPSTQALIFEPFFTTKGAGGVGKGTGLGLAAVHGIVAQAGGSIDVSSEVGRGTTFKIYLPRVDAASLVSPLQVEGEALPRGDETILVVEDEDRLRALAGIILESGGYTVLDADGGDRALRVSEQYEGSIDLLLTDVVMPGMNGQQVADLLTARRRSLRVLYMSGYTDDVVIRHGVAVRDASILAKPFTPAALIRKVREALDA